MAIDNVHVTTMAATPSHKRFKSTDPTTRKMAVLNQQFGLKGFNPDQEVTPKLGGRMAHTMYNSPSSGGKISFSHAPTPTNAHATILQPTVPTEASKKAKEH